MIWQSGSTIGLAAVEEGIVLPHLWRLDIDEKKSGHIGGCVQKDPLFKPINSSAEVVPYPRHGPDQANRGTRQPSRRITDQRCMRDASRPHSQIAYIRQPTWVRQMRV